MAKRWDPLDEQEFMELYVACVDDSRCSWNSQNNMRREVPNLEVGAPERAVQDKWTPEKWDQYKSWVLSTSSDPRDPEFERVRVARAPRDRAESLARWEAKRMSPREFVERITRLDLSNEEDIEKFKEDALGLFHRRPSAKPVALHDLETQLLGPDSEVKYLELRPGYDVRFDYPVNSDDSGSDNNEPPRPWKYYSSLTKFDPPLRIPAGPHDPRYRQNTAVPEPLEYGLLVGELTWYSEDNPPLEF